MIDPRGKRMEAEKWHRHFGVYGVCLLEGRLLVIHKTSGPYRYRYDLPGGTMEPNETIEQALVREFREETGYGIADYKPLGFAEFIVKYELRDNTHIQHIPLLFEVRCVPLTAMADHHDAFSDDSCGHEWVALDQLAEDDCSPLVWKAKSFAQTRLCTYESQKLDGWITKQRSGG